MTDVFDTALIDIFSALGSEAVFTPSSGDAVTLYVNKDQAIGTQGGLDAGRVIVEDTIEYIIADIGREAVKGETFTIGSAIYTMCETVNNDGKTVLVTVK